MTSEVEAVRERDYSIAGERAEKVLRKVGIGVKSGRNAYDMDRMVFPYYEGWSCSDPIEPKTDSKECGLLLIGYAYQGKPLEWKKWIEMQGGHPKRKNPVMRRLQRKGLIKLLGGPDGKKYIITGDGMKRLNKKNMLGVAVEKKRMSEEHKLVMEAVQDVLLRTGHKTRPDAHGASDSGFPDIASTPVLYGYSYDLKHQFAVEVEKNPKDEGGLVRRNFLRNRKRGLPTVFVPVYQGDEKYIRSALQWRKLEREEGKGTTNVLADQKVEVGGRTYEKGEMIFDIPIEWADELHERGLGHRPTKVYSEEVGSIQKFRSGDNFLVTEGILPMKEEERERLKERLRIDQRVLELKREHLRSSNRVPPLHAEVRKTKGGDKRVTVRKGFGDDIEYIGTGTELSERVVAAESQIELNGLESEIIRRLKEEGDW